MTFARGCFQSGARISGHGRTHRASAASSAFFKTRAAAGSSTSTPLFASASASSASASASPLGGARHASSGAGGAFRAAFRAATQEGASSGSGSGSFKSAFGAGPKASSSSAGAGAGARPSFASGSSLPRVAASPLVERCAVRLSSTQGTVTRREMRDGVIVLF